MKPCKSCGELVVNPEEEPRYDVLHPDFTPGVTDMSEVGPYCELCFAGTVTGAPPDDVIEPPAESEAPPMEGDFGAAV